jgi:CBS domain-containing protein
MQARDIMTSPAITVTAGTHIPELARIMRANQISGIPVVDDNGKLLGIVTDHDLILRNAPVRQPRYFSVLSGMIPLHLDEYKHYKEQLRHTMAVKAGDLIEPGIHTITPDTPLEEAMETMLDPKVTILPVVENDLVVGVVTRTDLVRLIERLEGALNPEAQEEAIEEKVLAGLTETILYVQEMNAAVAFYRDQLGLDVESPADSADYGQESWVVLETGACKLALHSGGQRRLGEDTPMIVFGVSDVEQARTVLVERGVALEAIFEAAPGLKVCHGRDPEGNPFALEEQSK